MKFGSFGSLLSFGFRLSNFFASFGCASFEFLDGAGGVQKILLASVEGVAVGANFNMHLWLGGTSGESVAAGADDFGISMILWVDICSHKA